MADYTIKVVISSDAKDLISALKKSNVQVEKFTKSTKEAAPKTRAWGKDLLKLGTAVGIGMGLAELSRRVVTFTKESLEASRATAAARGALVATTGSLDNYYIAIEQARTATMNMVDEATLAAGVNVMLASGLAKNATEAGELAQSGSILTQVYSASGATMEKYVRLLQSGGIVLYDNFGLTQDMVNAKKAEVTATEGLTGEEAKLKAIRILLQEASDKYLETMEDTVISSAQAEAATKDMQAAFGDMLAPAVHAVNVKMAEFFRATLDYSQSSEDFRQRIFDGASTWKEYTYRLRQAGFALKITESVFDDMKRTMAKVTHEDWRLQEAQERTRQSIDELTGAIENQVDAYTYVMKKSGEWEKVLIDDAWKAARDQGQAYDWAEYHRYEYYEALEGYYDDYLTEQDKNIEAETKALEQQVEDYQELIDARVEMYQDLRTGQADYLIGLKEMNADALQSESDYLASLGEVHASAGESKAEAEEALSTRLDEIEKARAEKIAWVRTGAHARTAEEEAEAERFHNETYDRMRDEAIAKTKEKTDGILAEEGRKASALAAAREVELAEQQAAMEEMKLLAALTVMEQAGLLTQFTSGMATTASDAALLIKAGVLPVTEEMGLAVQTALGNATADSEAMGATAETSAGILSQAFIGAIDEGVIPSLQTMDTTSTETFDAMKLKVSDEVMPALGDEGLGGYFTTMANENIPLVATAHETAMGEVITKLQEVQSEATTVMDSYTGDFGRGRSSVDLLNDSLGTTYDGLSDLIEKAEALEKKLDKLSDVEVQVHYYTTGTPPGESDDRQAGTPGGGFIVPPGYPHDSYRMGVETGERVSVTPAAAVRRGENWGGSVVNNYNTFNQTVNTRATVGTTLMDYRAFQAVIGA